MILKIDTTDRELIKVSLEKDDQLLDQTEDKNKFGSQILLGAIDKLLKKHNLEFKDLTAVEVNPGPGSFTGIKVGAAVANALGYSLNIPVNGKARETELKYV